MIPRPVVSFLKDVDGGSSRHKLTSILDYNTNVMAYGYMNLRDSQEVECICLDPAGLSW